MDALPEPIPRYHVEPVQYAGLLLVHWHSHIHAVVTEGVFTESGHFVHIGDTWRHRAIGIWQDKVFDLLLDAHKIDDDVVANMRDWKHSGFSVDNSVKIEAADHAGMQRLIQYIARCPFSLGRMVSLTDDGKILYKAGKTECLPFPVTGDVNLTAGTRRNFETCTEPCRSVFDPLGFLAEVTQHIPDKGEHQFRFYGWYSNKNRGLRQANPVAPANAPPAVADEYWEKLEPETAFRKKCRMTWAALIKSVYEAVH